MTVSARKTATRTVLSACDSSSNARPRRARTKRITRVASDPAACR